MSKNQSSSAQSGKKTRIIILIVILVLLAAAFIGGFFGYVYTHRIFPNMPGLTDKMSGTDHFASEDHVGLYDYGNMEDITGSDRTEAERVVLTKKNGLIKQNVRVDTTSYSTYSLLPCNKPVDIELIFDQDQQLCCTQFVYHYASEAEMADFTVEMDRVNEAVQKRMRGGNPLNALYDTLAKKFDFKEWNVLRTDNNGETQIVVQEFYRTNAYN